MRDSRTALGEIIRRQRELSQLPLRQFAATVGISGPYLSQIERGLRAPSDVVLGAIARSLQTSAEALHEQAGFRSPDEQEDEEAENGGAVRDAIRADESLTSAQRRALLEMYDACRAANRRRSDSAT